jgi:hypothetical protein
MLVNIPAPWGIWGMYFIIFTVNYWNVILKLSSENSKLWNNSSQAARDVHRNPNGFPY